MDVMFTYVYHDWKVMVSVFAIGFTTKNYPFTAHPLWIKLLRFGFQQCIHQTWRINLKSSPRFLWKAPLNKSRCVHPQEKSNVAGNPPLMMISAYFPILFPYCSHAYCSHENLPGCSMAMSPIAPTLCSIFRWRCARDLQCQQHLRRSQAAWDLPELDKKLWESWTNTQVSWEKHILKQKKRKNTPMRRIYST